MTFPLDPDALEAAEAAHARVARDYRNSDDPQSFDASAAEECVRAYLAAEPLRAGIARLSQVGLENSGGVPYQAWLPDDRSSAA